MPRSIIREVVIRNFKSIREVGLELRRGVNILVGPNGAGKTNILEALYFLRKALIDDYNKTPYLPHIEWWDPLNILPERSPGDAPSYTIRGETVLDDEHGEVIYEYSVSFILTPDRVTIAPYQHRLSMTIISSGRSAGDEVRLSIELAPGNIRITLPRSIGGIKPAELGIALRELAEKSMCNGEKCVYEKRFEWGKPYINLASLNDTMNISPLITEPTMLLLPLLLGFTVGILEGVLSSIVFIRHPDIGQIREPQRMFQYMVLRPRAENLAAVLYRLRREKPGFLEEIGDVVERFFPGTRLDVEVLPDGRAALMMYEGGKAYPAPCIPDGLIKLATLKTAMALEPSLLLVDEIENSMHAEMLRYIYDDLNHAPYPVVAATHSPHLVDLAGPERTLLVRREPGKDTVVEKIEEPRKLMEKLEKLGLSFSDYIYR